MKTTFAISRSWSQLNFPSSISFTSWWMRPWNGAAACLNRSAGIPENPGALWEGILCMNCENSLNVFTGSWIVSPFALVRKSNIPALSRKFYLLSDASCCKSVSGPYGSIFWPRKNVLCFYFEKVALVWSSW